MRGLDFSSWSGLVTTLLGMVLITFVMVVIRLLVTQVVQQKRERENRQINERLRTLISAYKVLGGSFTGILTVDPTHLRDLQAGGTTSSASPLVNQSQIESSERSRRIRDAVEGALSDLILLGTEKQMRLAAGAANDLVAGKMIRTDELVESLRDFIREVLDLEPVPGDLSIPKQGPSRTIAAAGGSGKGKGGDEGGNKSGGQGAGAMGGGGMALGGGFGIGLGAGMGATDEDGRN